MALAALQFRLCREALRQAMSQIALSAHQETGERGSLYYRVHFHSWCLAMLQQTSSSHVKAVGDHDWLELKTATSQHWLAPHQGVRPQGHGLVPIIGQAIFLVGFEVKTLGERSGSALRPDWRSLLCKPTAITQTGY